MENNNRGTALALSGARGKRAASDTSQSLSQKSAGAAMFLSKKTTAARRQPVDLEYSQEMPVLALRNTM
jgi:hypothetical protein